MDKDMIIAELRAENNELKSENAKLKLLNEHYIEQLRVAARRMFGSSSERTQLPDQVNLFNEAESLANETEAEVEEVSVRKRKKGKGKRDVHKTLILHYVP